MFIYSYHKKEICIDRISPTALFTHEWSSNSEKNGENFSFPSIFIDEKWVPGHVMTNPLHKIQIENGWKTRRGIELEPHKKRGACLICTFLFGLDLFMTGDLVNANLLCMLIVNKIKVRACFFKFLKTKHFYPSSENRYSWVFANLKVSC